MLQNYANPSERREIIFPLFDMSGPPVNFIGTKEKNKNKRDLGNVTNS